MEKALQIVGAITAVVSAMAVLASILFEFGYFSVVGLTFMRIATVQDYISNALVWLPLAVYSSVIMFGLSLHMDRVFDKIHKTVVGTLPPASSGTSTTEELQEQIRHLERVGKRSRYFIRLPLSILMIATLLFGIYTQTVVMAIYYVMIVVLWYILRTAVEKRYGLGTYELLSNFAPMVCLSFILAGGLSGARALNHDGAITEIDIKGDRTVLATVLRVYGGGFSTEILGECSSSLLDGTKLTRLR